MKPRWPDVYNWAHKLFNEKYSVKQIAKKLEISEATVYNYLGNPKPWTAPKEKKITKKTVEMEAYLL